MAAALILSACSGPVSVTPDAHCRGEITGETLRDKLADAIEDCAPMIRATVEL